MFACLTRADSWDESDSPCELCSAPKSMDNDCVPYGTHKPTDDGCSATYGSSSTPPGLPSAPQSSRQHHSNTNTTQDSWVFRRPVFLGPPDEPAVMKPVVPKVVHPVQYGSTPKLLLLPHSDMEILSYIDDDISSIRDGKNSLGDV